MIVTARLRARQPLTLLAWGDSISEVGRTPNWSGGASAPERNWARLLGERIREQFQLPAVNVISAGVGGENATEGLARNPLSALAEPPQLVLIAFGTNDAGYHYQPPDRYADALRGMVRLAAAVSDVGLLTTGPLLSRPIHEPESAYRAAAQAVGRELHVPVVDIAAAVNARLSAGARFEDLHLAADNIHPNDAGHVIWADAVWNALFRTPVVW